MVQQKSRTASQPDPRPSWVAAGIAVGSALALYAFTQRTRSTAALAALGVIAFTKGSLHSAPQSFEAHTSVAINCTPGQAYRLWHDFENLPRFMQYLESVKVLDNNRSEWTALGPLNTKFHWTASITDDRENERIAWRSMHGSEVDTEGSIEFRTGPNGRGTFATIKLRYVPPAGAVGKAAAALLGKDPKFTIREDVRRFKALLEAGEIPTTMGQSHGPRTAKGHLQELLLHERDQSSPPADSSMRQAG